jgi:transposase
MGYLRQQEIRMTVRPVVWVGVDAGKAAHHAAAVDEQGRLCWSQKVPNDQAAIEELIARAAATAAQVRWAVDLTGSAAALLLAALVAVGQQVAYVPGRTVNRMAGMFPGEGKTDAKDARLIAETARICPDLAIVTPREELVAELARLTAHRADLMADWVRGVNRLRDLLTSVFPGLERAFDYSTRSALILVSGYQTPKAIREVGPGRLSRFLLENGAPSRKVAEMAASAMAAAAAQTVQLPGEASAAVLIAGMARQLLGLDRQIKDTTRLISERFRIHPQAAVIESMPGMGPVLGAEFLVATSGNLTAFATSGHLAAYAGLVPVPQDSGRITGNLRRPQRYNRRLRHVFYMAAFSSIKADGPSRTFYQRKRAERLTHTQALLALGRRLVDVLWALLRDNRHFTATPPRPAPQAA